MKDKIRTNLKMIEENLPRFNDLSSKFLNKKKIRKQISVWRWYISHGYFKDGHPKPEGINSNPPISWLYSKLQGQTVPLARDIGTCISPVVESGLMTEQASLRIMDRLEQVYGYISTESALKSQQDHRDREDKKLKDARRAAKARVDRKAEREEEQQKFVEKEGPKLGKARLKKKASDRKEYQQALEARKKTVHERAVKAADKMKRAMRERRK